MFYLVEYKHQLGPEPESMKGSTSLERGRRIQQRHLCLSFFWLFSDATCTVFAFQFSVLMNFGCCRLTMVVFFFFLHYWGPNLGFYTCKVSTPHLSGYPWPWLQFCSNMATHNLPQWSKSVFLGKMQRVELPRSLGFSLSCLGTPLSTEVKSVNISHEERRSLNFPFGRFFEQLCLAVPHFIHPTKSWALPEEKKVFCFLRP